MNSPHKCKVTRKRFPLEASSATVVTTLGPRSANFCTLPRIVKFFTIGLGQVWQIMLMLERILDICPKCGGVNYSTLKRIAIKTPHSSTFCVLWCRSAGGAVVLWTYCSPCTPDFAACCFTYVIIWFTNYAISEITHNYDVHLKQWRHYTNFVSYIFSHSLKLSLWYSMPKQSSTVKHHCFYSVCVHKTALG